MDDEQVRAHGPLLLDLLSLYPPVVRLDVRKGYWRVGSIAHGWYMRVMRGAEAVLALERSGFAGEAPPLRRSMIEHHVALQWLAAEGDGIVDTLKRGHEIAVAKEKDAVIKAAWETASPAEFDAAIASVAGADRSNDYLLHFANRVRKYGTLDDLPGYFAETALSHPTFESAAAYLDQPSNDLRVEARNVVPQVPFCVTILMASLVGISRIYVDPPWQKDLERIVMRSLEIDKDYRRRNGLSLARYEALENPESIPNIQDGTMIDGDS